MDVTAYESGAREAWDRLVDASPSATFQQSRRFLDYHGDRFADASLLFHAKGQLMAVWPAAASLSEPGVVVSHPGAVHGGPVTHSKLYRIEQFEALVDGARSAWRARGFDRYVHRPVPPRVVRVPDESTEYWLWRRGARWTRHDLWNALPLDTTFKLTKGLKDNLRIARREGLEVQELVGAEASADFHALLVTCLDARHETTPVHSLEELRDLQDRLGSRQALWGVRGADGALLAATWLFHYPGTTHTQYIASSAEGRQLGAPAWLLHHLIERRRGSDDRWFSFGASSLDGGADVNEGLFRFKAGFGGGSAMHRHLELDLADGA